jgi:hypothetical protein
MSRDAWNSHQWSENKPRRIEKDGETVLQRHCSRCSRDFTEDPASGERFAVYVSVFSLQRLPSHISKQWLEELCPGTPLPFDIEVRGRLIQHRVQ